ncbi:hypothetical protein M422DRAFT_24825 [Sphaerobolus stellatus SS14]|nr:hypothetical protein M422DRAFT_24825 [Sphaerobolus stellatus SS14]
MSTTRPTDTPSKPSGSKLIFLTDATPTKSKSKSSPQKRARGTPRGGKAAASGTPRRTPRKRVNLEQEHERIREDDDDSDEDDEEEDSENEEDEDGDHALLSTLQKSASAAPGKTLIHRTAFDVYFSLASKPARTSDNVFSERVEPLTPVEYTRLLSSSETLKNHAPEYQKIFEGHTKLFPRYALELQEGFNLLFFGFGSKRNLLNAFAKSFCAKKGYVVIVNGYMPRIGVKDLISSIEEVPGLTSLPLTASTLEAQTKRIYSFLLPPAVRPNDPTSPRPLFLIIHNIDSPAFRTPRAKALLSLLALNPRIHIIASTDHINAQMLFSTSEASTRKHSYVRATEDIPPTRGFAWVWHDMTTLGHYEAELAHVDVTSASLGRAGKMGGAAGGAGERGMTETAAQHILMSVNVKAKKLFALLGKTLLDSLEEAGAGAGGGPNKGGDKQLQACAVSYDALFNAARTDFIATNDTTFKALLAEFRDHGLVVLTTVAGAEALWIPLRPEELRRVLGGLSTE